jgi:hypothetical protein
LPTELSNEADLNLLFALDNQLIDSNTINEISEMFSYGDDLLLLHLLSIGHGLLLRHLLRLSSSDSTEESVDDEAGPEAVAASALHVRVRLHVAGRRGEGCVRSAHAGLNHVLQCRRERQLGRAQIHRLSQCFDCQKTRYSGEWATGNGDAVLH